MNRQTLTLGCSLLVLAALGSTAARAQETTDDRVSYSFVRTLEGDASVAPAGRGVAEAIEVNQPLVTGDLVRVEGRARAEIVLADRTRLVLGGDTQAVLERIAFSADRDDRATRLRLIGGEMLLAVDDNALGDDLPTVATDVATVYVQQPGTYVLRGDRDWLEVTVRDGYAEVVSDRGSSIVRRGESVLVDAGRGGAVRVSQAGGPTALERWNDDLYDRGSRASMRYVDPEYRYVAAPLDDYGSWVDYDGGWCWRPRVQAGWRPYWDGRWAATPSGLTWVSREPWGWYPYHYGSWVFATSYGWVWRPGRCYSPAWVYWYWGDNYAGWCPVGYYSDYYRGWYPHFGLRVGLYGWIGGRVDLYAHWNFAPLDCFRDRHFRGRLRTGHDFERELGRDGRLPRGVLTTDTRDLPFDRMGKPGEIPRLLRERAERISGQRVTELPDVTDFVGRKSDLPNTVRAAVLIDRESRQPRLTLPADEKPRGGEVVREPGWKTRHGELEKLPAEVARGSKVGERPQVEYQAPRTGVDRQPRSVGQPAEDRKVDDRKVEGRRTDGDSRQPAARPGTVTPQPGDGARRALPGTVDSPRGDDRQGWKREAPPAATGGGTARTLPPDRTGASPVDRIPRQQPVDAKGNPQADDDPPVRRVVDGVRSTRPRQDDPAAKSGDDRPGRPEGGSRWNPGDDKVQQAPPRSGSQPPQGSAPRYLPPQGGSSSGNAPRSQPAQTSRPPAGPPPANHTPPPSSGNSKPAPRTESQGSHDRGSHSNTKPSPPPPPPPARHAVGHRPA